MNDNNNNEFNNNYNNNDNSYGNSNNYNYGSQNQEPYYEAADYSSRYQNMEQENTVENTVEDIVVESGTVEDNQGWHRAGDADWHTGSRQGQSEYSSYTSGSQGQTEYTSYAGATGYTGASGGSYGTPQREKKPGFGVKLVKVAAVAAVFGLVAGVVFQGVDMAADYFRGGEEITIQTPVAATTTNDGSAGEQTDLTQLITNSMPSMVSITSTITTNYSYFGQQFSEDQEGSGSGIIVGMNNKELLVATNNHVIADATAIQVCFIDNEIVKAEIKGTDSTADLAVVSIPLEDIKESTLQSIKVATLGDSENVLLGEKVVAIGNALGYGQSITVGYVSATDRQVTVSSGQSANTMTLLQTDAAINPGNSGGALLNMKGEVIGINTVKYADTSVEGMGYAIPISSATPIINELMNYEKLSEDEKGYLGITGTDVTESNNLYNMPNGVYVYDLAKDGAAAKGGMQKGDIITKINGNAVTNMEAVQQKVNNTRVGTEITVTVMRNENGEYIEKELKVVLQGKESLKSLTTENEKNTESQQPQRSPQENQEGYYEENPFGNGLLEDFLERFGN